MRKKSTTRSFKNREEDLRRVLRYHKFKIMFYRTNLSLHSARVQRIVEVLLPFALKHYPQLDPKKAVLIAKFHDDPEMVSKRGDVSLQLKLRMNKEEVYSLKQEETEAAEFLISSYGNPTIQGYSYRDLVMHALRKDCPEAQLHSFADKVDGYGEALHEVLAGNTCFVEAVINYVAKTFNDLPGHFPLIAKVFEDSDGPFVFPVICLKKYFEDGLITSQPHTPESIARKAEIPHYELWKRATLDLPNGLQALTEQKESQKIHLLKPLDAPQAKVLSISKPKTLARSIV